MTIDIFAKTAEPANRTPLSYDELVPFTYTVGVSYAATILGSSAAPTVTRINHPVRALGLHGILPHGTIAIAAPLQYANALEAYVVNSGNPWRRMPNAYNASGQISPPPYAVVLERGGVHDFGVDLQGVAIFVGAPWVDVMPLIGANYRLPSALIRTYQGSVPAPQSLPYTDISASTWLGANPPGAGNANLPTIDAPFTAAIPYGAFIQGAKELVLEWTEPTPGIPGFTPVAAPHTQTANVWWRMEGNLCWVHNEADDLDPAGRGAITSTHSVEGYIVPSTAQAIAIMPTAGDQLELRIHSR